MDWSAFISTIGIGATTAQAAGLKFQEFAAALATLSGVVGNHGIRSKLRRTGATPCGENCSYIGESPNLALA